MIIDHLRPWEKLPQENFDSFDCDWVWVVRDPEIKAALLAAPAHGTVFLLRIVRYSDLPSNWLMVLMKYARKEWVRRGYDRYFTFLSWEHEEERAILKAMRRDGANIEEFRGSCVGGRAHA